MEIYYHDDVGVSVRPSVVFTGLDGSPTWNVENASFVAYKPGGSGSVPSMHQSGSMGPLGSGSWPADPVGDVVGLYYADIWVPVPWAETYKGTWIVYMEAQILPDNTRVGTTVTFAVDRYSPGAVYDRIGPPSGSALVDDIAVIDAVADTIKEDTDKFFDSDMGSPGSLTDGSFADRFMNKSGSKTYDESTDSLEAIRDAVGNPVGGSVVDDIHTIYDHTKFLFSTSMAELTGGSFADNVLNKDGSKTFDPSTDSLEAIRDIFDTRVPSEVAQKLHLVDGSGDIGPPTDKGLWDALGDGTERAMESSVSTVEGKIDTVDTVADAIKAKTDNLPVDPASATNVTDAVDSLNGASDRDLTEVYDLVSTVDGKVDTVDGVVDTIVSDTNKLFDSDMGSPGSLTSDSFADRLMNKDGSKTYDETTDSLEALGEDTDTLITNVADVDSDLVAAASDVTAIKAKTDNLPADPASSTNVTSAVDTLNGADDRNLTQIYDLIETAESNIRGVGSRDLTEIYDAVAASGSSADVSEILSRLGDPSPDTITSLLTGMSVSVWGYGTRELTSFGSLTSDTATAVWAAGSRTLTGFSGVGAAVWGYSPRTLTAISSTLAATIWDVLASAVGGAGTMGQKLLYILDGNGAGQYAPFDPTRDGLADIRQTAECLAATGALPPWSEFS